MSRSPFARRATHVFAVAALAACAPAGAAPAGASRFAGTYTVTQVGGAGVERLELQLRTDGHAMLRTDFSRLTQRPVESTAVPPVLEHGTWRERNGRAVVHIIATSSDDANMGDQRPQYADMTFVLTGCELRLIAGNGPPVEFSKRHCLSGA